MMTDRHRATWHIGRKFRSGSMAFLFVARPTGVADFRAQPSLKPAELK
jgi:hypothetical protein